MPLTMLYFFSMRPYGPEEVWDKLPHHVQQQIIDKHIQFYVVDAKSIAKDTGMGNKVNGILQTCFFAISGILPQDEAISKIKDAVAKTYKRKGEEVIQRNFNAIDATLKHLYKVNYPDKATHADVSLTHIPDSAPDFVNMSWKKLCPEMEIAFL